MRELNESIRLQGKGGTAMDYLFLALAQHHLGRPDEARRSLEKGLKVERAEAVLPENERQELHLLRREATALLSGPAPEEKK